MSYKHLELTRRSTLLGAAAVVAGASMAGKARASEDIVIGASLPLSGPLAGFGAYVRWGYTHAIEQVNAAGGLTIDGEQRRVRLEIRDDRTDPNLTASNTETLISRDGAIAILSSPTPPLVAAGGLVAERNRIPFVSGSAPLESFKAIRHWRYAWDLFFHEPELGAAPFQMMTDYNLETNRRIAILHDNGPDGQVVGGQAWPAIAAAFGYEIVHNAAFPMDANQFTSVIADAKASEADIVLVMSSTPQAVAIRKQMAAGDYLPKVLVMERGGEPEQFREACGPLADGVLVGAYWDPTFPFPGAQELADAYVAETGQTWSRHISASNAAAHVLLDAIARAGSLDGDAINDEIAATNATYVVGPVAFDENHTSKLPIALSQWNGENAVIVWPQAQANSALLFPMPLRTE